jgi:hypothetical protein
MRATFRVCVFAIITVVTVAVTPAWAGSVSDWADVAIAARAARAVAAAESAGPTEEDLLGTWTGTIVPDGSADALDGGIIAIGRDVTGLVVTVGPNVRLRHASKRVMRTERGLRFEVWLPGDETRLLVYDLRIDGGTMTGLVTYVRHGATEPASLAFFRQ